MFFGRILKRFVDLYDANFVMTGKRGAPRKPEKGTLARFQMDQPRDWPVYEFVRDQVAALGNKWGSKEAAIEAAQVKFGIARKTVQRKFAEMEKWDDALRRATEVAQQCLAEHERELIHLGTEWRANRASLKARIAEAEFTEDEICGLGHLEFAFASKIADAFIELKRLRKLQDPREKANEN